MTIRPFIHVPIEKIWRYAPSVIEAGLGVEIKLSADWLDQAAPDELKRVEELLLPAAGRISVHAPFEDMCPLSRDRAIRQISRDRLSSALRFALRVKARAIVYHSSYEELKHSWKYEAFLDEAAEFFGALAREGRSGGVDVNLENVFETDPAPLKEMIEREGSGALGWCLDLGHYNFLSRVPLEEWFNALLKHLRHAHMHENWGKKDDHLPLGSCGISTLEIIKRFPSLMVFTLENHQPEHFFQSLEYLQQNNLLAPELGTFDSLRGLI